MYLTASTKKNEDLTILHMMSLKNKGEVNENGYLRVTSNRTGNQVTFVLSLKGTSLTSLT
jgi:hypothetical protein